MKTILALKDSLRNITTSMKDKKTLIERAAFPLFLKNSLKKPKTLANIAYLSIIKKNVYNALVT